MATQEDARRKVEEQERRIKENLDRVENRIVVFSGKGGVGKTTMAVNLACSLVNHGRVGLLDADVTGPDVPTMMGLHGQLHMQGDRILPLEKHGVKVVSLAAVIPPDSPVLWRGPMRSKALYQFLGDVSWGELDYLVADLPPGTGDEVMTIAQQMAPQLAVIVTTPQEMSLVDCRRAISMAKSTGIPHIGVVENMSGLHCPVCGCLIEVLGSGGGKRLAKESGVEFLGRVPLSLTAREAADQGRPIVVTDGGAAISQALRNVTDGVMRLCAGARQHRAIA
jgi:Mrp family chromosome partitioning ATPase